MKNYDNVLRQGSRFSYELLLKGGGGPIEITMELGDNWDPWVTTVPTESPRTRKSGRSWYQ